MSSDQCACGQVSPGLGMCESCQFAYYEVMGIIDEMLRSIDSSEARAALESLSMRLNKRSDGEDILGTCEECGVRIYRDDTWGITGSGCYLCESCKPAEDVQPLDLRF